MPGSAGRPPEWWPGTSRPTSLAAAERTNSSSVPSVPSSRSGRPAPPSAGPPAPDPRRSGGSPPGRRLDRLVGDRIDQARAEQRTSGCAPRAPTRTARAGPAPSRARADTRGRSRTGAGPRSAPRGSRDGSAPNAARSAFRRDPRAFAATRALHGAEGVLEPPRAEVHVERVAEARNPPIVPPVAVAISMFRSTLPGAARPSLVVAIEARLGVEDRPEAIAAVAPRVVRSPGPA